MVYFYSSSAFCVVPLTCCWVDTMFISKPVYTFVYMHIYVYIGSTYRTNNIYIIQRIMSEMNDLSVTSCQHH